MRTTFLPLLIITLLALSGCKQGAESFVKSYYTSLEQKNYDEAYKFLSLSDKKIRTLEEYKENYNTPFERAAEAKTSQEVLSVKESGDEALAIVKTTAPDPRGLMGKWHLSEKEKATILEDDSFPLKTTEEVVKLVKEDSGWKINLEFEQQKKREQRADQNYAEMRKEIEALENTKAHSVRELSINLIKIMALQGKFLAQDDEYDEKKFIEECKDEVRKQLKDPESAQFSDVRVQNYPKGRLICGNVNAKNAYGGYVGFVPFVASHMNASIYKSQETENYNAGLIEACQGSLWGKAKAAE